jgi:hypothetical protein
MFKSSETKHKVVVEKAFIVEQASKNVVDKYENYKCHKTALA